MPTTLLNVTATPMTFAGGTYGTAATALNTGTWRFSFTPTAASGTYVGGNFHILLGGPHGGIWLDDAQLELYDAPADDLCFQRAMTWSAGQTITVLVDTRPGTRAVTITGATTGNGTFTFATAGPYFTDSDALDIGKFTGGGASFDFVGTVSSVDDGVQGLTAQSGAFALTGQAVTLRAARRIAAASGAFTLTGTAATLTRTTGGLSALAGAFTLAGQTATLKRTYAMTAAAGSFSLSGTAATLRSGTQVAIGAHAVDAQPFPFSDRDALVTIDTQVSGSVVVISGGGRSSDLGLTWTDSKGNTIRKLAAVLDYPDFGGYGTQVGITANPMTGGTGQAITIQVGNEDENTSFAVEAIVGGRGRVTSLHTSASDTGAGTTQSIGPITTDGPAVLLAFWYGAAPVTPPFVGTSGPHGTGVGTAFTAVPNNSFVVLDSYLNNFQNGEVQAACAGKVVDVAGSYSVTWTHSPAQGAELWLVAVQPAARVTADAGAIALSGSAATLTTARRLTLTAASGSLVLTGQAAGLGVAHRLTAASGIFAIAGQTAGLQSARRMSAASGALALTGSSAGLRAARNLPASAGSFAIAGSAAALRTNRRLQSTAGAFALAGSDATLHGQGAFLLVAGSGAVALSGQAAALRAARRIAALGGAYAVTGTAAALTVVAARTLAASAGAITLTGTAAALVSSGAAPPFYAAAVPGADAAYADPGAPAAIYPQPVPGGFYG